MSLFSSILVPLDGSRTAARSLGCATWLASRLGARLHILSATPRQLPAREELARLRVPQEHWPLIALHQAPAYPEGAILAALTRYDVGLLVMTARGETVEAPAPVEPFSGSLVGHVARAVIEQSAAPVLLLPPNYREALPWERVLVPVSGEDQTDEALALAARLADALDLEVHAAHVMDEAARTENLAAKARYADALHHEYAGQLEELISRALPHGGPEARPRIREVALGHGDVAAELVALMARTRASVLVVGWRGRFMAGRARVLKHLIQTIASAVLLVKPEARAPLRLKVGEELD